MNNSRYKLWRRQWVPSMHEELVVTLWVSTVTDELDDTTTLSADEIATKAVASKLLQTVICLRKLVARKYTKACCKARCKNSKAS